MKRVGIVLSLYDFRNDIRELVSFLSTKTQVVVFYNEYSKISIDDHVIKNVEYRQIDERSNTVYNRIILFFYTLFKQIPKSKINYLLMEEFRWGGIRKMPLIIKLSYLFKKIGLNFFRYDDYIDNLQCTGRTEISDIDKFVFLTSIPCDFFLGRLIKEHRKIDCYVYSWDHPCKHSSFSRRINYLVWSESLRKDLVELQRVSYGSVRVVGATQFCYIHEFVKSDFQDCFYDFDYIYYCCSVGIKGIVIQEIEIIMDIANWLSIHRPSLFLVVRLYPVLDDWNLYKKLEKIKNVILENDFRSKDLSMTKDDIFKKLTRIRFSKFVIHTGSTIGLESLLLGKDSYLIYFDYLNKSNIWNFINQHQNVKYFVNGGHVMRSLEDIDFLLSGREIIPNKNNDFFTDSLKSVSEKILNMDT